MNKIYGIILLLFVCSVAWSQTPAYPLSGSATSSADSMNVTILIADTIDVRAMMVDTLRADTAIIRTARINDIVADSLNIIIISTQDLLADSIDVRMMTADSIHVEDMRVDSLDARVISVDSIAGDLKIKGDLHVEGDLIYEFIHAYGGVAGADVTPDMTQNVYLKLNPGSTWLEIDGMSCTGDSITILTDGDYYIDISLAISGANQNDFWRVKPYVNSVAYASEVSAFRWRVTTAGVSDTRDYFWYLRDLDADDVISFWITNETGSRDPTISQFKIYIEKKPE